MEDAKKVLVVLVGTRSISDVKAIAARENHNSIMCLMIE